MAIEKDTKLQAESKLWREERAKRVTASNVGVILSARPGSMGNYARMIMIPRDLSRVNAISWGVQHEAEALREFSAESGLAVSRSGLWISPQYPFLAASPGECHLSCFSVKPEGNHYLLFRLLLLLNLMPDCYFSVLQMAYVKMT